MRATRPVVGVVDAQYALEGAGFGVYRPIPTPALPLLDPFLLLDEMAPRELAPGEAVGAPDHPHRGFETVTYVLDGEVEHADSAGNRDVIGPGDVQWMTAGAGIVHAEMPSTRIQTEGGRVHGFQLWVNLPAADKMTPPRYQAITADQIPTVDGPGWRARVVAGTVAGVDGPARTRTPVDYAHVSIGPGATFELTIAHDHSVGLYVFEGRGVVADEVAASARQFVVFDGAGETIQFRANEATEALVLSGRPLGEPVARHGPFVMNTRAELIEAFEDFQRGRMGSITPTAG